MELLAVDSFVNPYDNATGWTWFVRFVDIRAIWRLHPTSLCHELDFFVGALLSLIHAFRTGGRYPYLWLAIVLHGLFLECVVCFSPNINNFWHALGTVTLLEGRTPLHILMLYPTFIYPASVAVAKTKLPTYIQPFAVGVCTVLMDMPYDIMGIKLLWWTWHDTDPNLHDRNYYVPWTSYYFHATFAASVTFFNHLLRKVIIGKDRYDPQSGSVPKELLVCMITSFVGMPGGVLLFIPLYHPMHDVYGIHSECIVIALIFTFIIISWSADRNPPSCQKLPKPGILVLLIAFHYTLYILLVVFADPENSVVVGLHQRTGPCNETTIIHSPVGQALARRTYLCTSDYDEPFDFHCTRNGTPPADGYNWYTICGTPYTNQAEYIFVITCICIFGMVIYLQMFLSAGTEIFTPLTNKKFKTK